MKISYRYIYTLMYIYVYKCAKTIPENITRLLSYINIIIDWIYIYYLIKNRSNENSHTSLTKQLKYHYPDEITVITIYYEK